MLHKEFFELAPPFTVRKHAHGWTLHAQGATLGAVRRETRIFGTINGAAIECEKNGVMQFDVELCDLASMGLLAAYNDD